MRLFAGPRSEKIKGSLFAWHDIHVLCEDTHAQSAVWNVFFRLNYLHTHKHKNASGVSRPDTLKCLVLLCTFLAVYILP